MREELAMDLFPAGDFVRLRSFSRDAYLRADEDAVGVSLVPPEDDRRPSLNEVWKVEHWYAEGAAAPFVLLQGAAYGRYLAVDGLLLPGDPNFGDRRLRIIQRDYESQCPFLWRPYRFVSLYGNYDDVRFACWGYRLCNSGWPSSIRRNRNPVRPYAYPASGVATLWTVEPVQQSRVPLPLPPRPPPQMMNVVLGCSQPEPLRRRIRHVRATDEGHVHLDLVDWPDFFHTGRSVLQLRDAVWLRQGIFNVPGIRLCMLAGRHAGPIPLATDLPANTDPMDIIVYDIGSPADERLVYPDLDELDLDESED